MKKIGLLTYHASLNNGSMLQTYALQQYITNAFSSNCEIINFSSDGQRFLYRLFDWRLNAKALVKNVLTLTHIRDFQRYRSGFARFRSEHFRESEEVHDSFSIRALADKYDEVVTGSDQIWNAKCPDFTYAYMADFLDEGGAIAYAPSFGGTPPGSDKRMALLLSRYKVLSTREQNGQNWIAKLTGRDAELVPDPTFLLSADDWSHLAGGAPIDRKYILFYGVSQNNVVFDQLKSLSKKTGLPVYIIDPSVFYFRFNNFRGFQLGAGGGPIGFLKWIKHAEIFLTSSFHGTVFGAMFEKKMYSIEYKNSNPSDDRVYTLLGQIAARDRIILEEEIATLDPSSMTEIKRQSEIRTLSDIGKRFLQRALG